MPVRGFQLILVPGSDLSHQPALFNRVRDAPGAEIVDSLYGIIIINSFPTLTYRLELRNKELIKSIRPMKTPQSHSRKLNAKS